MVETFSVIFSLFVEHTHVLPAASPPIGLVRLGLVDAQSRTSLLVSTELQLATSDLSAVVELICMSIQTYAYSTGFLSHHEPTDFVSSETVPNGGSSGPGLNGLQAISGSAAVNQSAGESQPTAHVRLPASYLSSVLYSLAHTSHQHHHHSRDPYPQAYPPYSSIPVSYITAYNPEGNIPTYYPHDASQHSHSDSHQGHRDQHQRSQQSVHNEPINHPALQQSESTAPATSTQDEESSQPFTEPSASVSKRRYGSTNGSEDETQLSRRQRPRLFASGAHTDTDAELMKEDSEVGPSGGPKHWTDEEKARLFHWMLDDDERWEAFGTKMNTIFREVSSISSYPHHFN